MSEQIYIDGERQNKIFIRANPNIPGHGQVSEIWEKGNRIYLEAADIDIKGSEFGTTVPAAGEKFYIPWGSQDQVTAYPISDVDARYRFAEWFRADKDGENRESFGTFNPLVITGNYTWREFEKPQLIPTYQAQYRLIFEVEGDATIDPSGIVWRDEGTVIPFAITATQSPGRSYRVRRVGLYDSITEQFIEWRWVGDLQNPVHAYTLNVPVPIETGVMPDRPVGTRDTYIDPRDGEQYDYVKMPDGKWWMVENLRYDIMGSVYYDFDPSLSGTYGKLYSHQEALDSVDGFGEGWRVPTQSDFNTLATAISGRGSAGKKLKATIEWEDDGEGTDDYGFTLLPGGVQNWDGTFTSKGVLAQIQASDTSEVPPDGTYAQIEIVTSDSDALTVGSESKFTRRSVRLVTDIDPNPIKPSPSKNKLIAEIEEYLPIITSTVGTAQITPSHNVAMGEDVTITTAAQNPSNQTWRLTQLEQVDTSTNTVLQTFESHPNITDLVTSGTANFVVDSNWRSPRGGVRATWQEYVYLNGTTGSATTGEGVVSGAISGDVDKNIDMGTSITVTGTVTAVSGRQLRVARFERTNASGTVQGSALATYAVGSPNTTESHTFTLPTDFRTPNNYIRAMFAEYVTVARAAGTNASITAGGNANYDFGSSVSFTATPASVTGQNWTIHQIQRQVGTGTWTTLTTRTTLDTNAATYSYTMNEDWRGSDVKIRAVARQYVTVTRGSKAGTGASWFSISGASEAGTNYAVGSTVSFTASVSDSNGVTASTIQWQSSSNGSTYTNISGATGTSYTLTVGTSNIWIRATAPARQYYLYMRRNPDSSWVAAPSLSPSRGDHLYNYNSSVSCSAGTGNTGTWRHSDGNDRPMTWNGWTGALSGTSSPQSVTMSTNRSVTANYRCRYT